MYKHPSHFGMQFKNIWFSKVVYIYALNVALQQFSFFLPQIIMAKSVQSAATTHRGVDFDDLVSGKVPPYYTFRPTRIKNKQDVCKAMPTKRDIEHTATSTEDYNNALYRATDTLVK